MFTPHTPSEMEAMLRMVGVQRIEDLFDDVPAQYRFPDLNLPAGHSELEALERLRDLSAANDTTQDMISFLGAGAYNHYIPAAVDAIIRRGEFLTAYTPYQPEISQGTLQAIFEYQSLMVALTGMDVCNASHYDGATAAAEAVNMAHQIYRGERKKIVLSQSVHPHYRATIHTYNRGSDLEICGEEYDCRSGPEALYSEIDKNTALVLVAYPDFFGRIYDYSELSKRIHEAGGLLAISVNPLSLGILKSPNEFQADIVTGEGQPLGIPLSFGGPYLGIFATKAPYVRKLAGRLAGKTIDTNGDPGYVLTLNTREQHIRREKATSNICTNQGLMALASTVYLSLLGKHGLREVANLCFQAAHFTAELVSQIPEVKVWDTIPFFNEFVVETPIPAQEINRQMLEFGILPGYVLSDAYPELQNHLLVAVTEMNSREQIEYFVEKLGEVSSV